MKPFTVFPLTKKLSVQFTKQSVHLPVTIQSKIDAYWNDLIAKGKSHQRGEVFTVIEKEHTEESITITVAKTDYAHYLYCQNIESLGKNGVQIIHTGALVETSDDFIIFGQMGSQTARAGIHQLCGSGIEYDDLHEGYFDFAHNITKELNEELGIDVTDRTRVHAFHEAYFKEGGPTDKMTVVYRVVLSETKDTFLEQYNTFEKAVRDRGEGPEFGSIIALKREKNEIEKFFSQDDLLLDEYMRPLFDHIMAESSFSQKGGNSV